VERENREILQGVSNRNVLLFVCGCDGCVADPTNAHFFTLNNADGQLDVEVDEGGFIVHNQPRPDFRDQKLAKSTGSKDIG
jgi:hypothetical protein